METRHRLTEEDQELLDAMTHLLTLGIDKLRETHLRPANIEIHLTHHIKTVLRKGGH